MLVYDQMFLWKRNSQGILEESKHVHVNWTPIYILPNIYMVNNAKKIGNIKHKLKLHVHYTNHVVNFFILMGNALICP